jgi:hypothetical protein
MNALETDLETRIIVDLGLARLELGEARRAQQAKDTPATRQRVAGARAHVDELLDMWNQLLPTPV